MFVTALIVSAMIVCAAQAANAEATLLRVRVTS